MKFLSVVVSLFVLGLFVAPGVAQNHSAHHPQQSLMVQADSTAGTGMMQGGMMSGKGMMQGGMMSGKSMMQGGMMSGQGKKPCGMMHGKGMMAGGMMGMMGGMKGMHGPMHKYMHLVHHLPDWQVKLNLTDGQIRQLKQIRADFLKKQADWKASMEKKQIDLGLLLDKKAPANEVKKLLSSYYDVKVAMKISAYQTAQKMKSVLTPAQLQKLKAGMPMGMCKMMGGGM